MQHGEGVFKINGEDITDIRQFDLVVRLRPRLLVGDDGLSSCPAMGDQPAIGNA